jgi:hypothetical protein
VFFRYTVQRDDSLSKLAQSYLGDRFRFYILAKYNDMANPSRLAAGQVIKIPGKAQPAPPASAAPARPAAPAEVAEPAPPPPAAPAPAAAESPAPATTPVAALLQKGRRLEAGGDLPGAYGAFNEAVAISPGNRDAILQRDAAKAALIRSYDREGNTGIPAAEPRSRDHQVGPAAGARSIEPEGEARARARAGAQEADEREVRKVGLTRQHATRIRSAKEQRLGNPLRRIPVGARVDRRHRSRPRGRQRDRHRARRAQRSRSICNDGRFSPAPRAR